MKNTPLTFAIIIFVLLAIRVLLTLKVSRKKETMENPNISDPDTDYNKISIPNEAAPSIPSDTGKLKRLGIKKVLRNYFSNGSCLAVMNDGRLVRIKSKYC